LELAYETYIYILVHSYVNCVYTRLKRSNLFTLILEHLLENVSFHKLRRTLANHYFVVG